MILILLSVRGSRVPVLYPESHNKTLFPPLRTSNKVLGIVPACGVVFSPPCRICVGGPTIMDSPEYKVPHLVPLFRFLFSMWYVVSSFPVAVFVVPGNRSLSPRTPFTTQV